MSVAFWIGFSVGFLTMFLAAATIGAILIHQGRIGIHTVYDPIRRTR